MSGEPVKALDPSLLLEASRVMNAAGPDYANAAKLVSGWALKNVSKADPETRAAIVGDAAALRLRVPGSYEKALELLTDIDGKECPDDDGRLHVLRALANGQKYKALKRAGKAGRDELDNLKKQIREDLAVAFKRDPTVKQDNRGYWVPPSSTEEGAVTGDAEDDLREVFRDDAEFRALVAE
jgi:hypothetical protein